MLSAQTQLPPFVHHCQTERGVLPPALRKCHDILAQNEPHQNSLQEQVMREIAGLNKAVSVFPSQASRRH